MATQSESLRSSAVEDYAKAIYALQARAGGAPVSTTALAERLGSVGLELHPVKTRVVYCKDTHRRKDSEHTSFDFLGYTFRGRIVRGRRGFFVGFNPAMSDKAMKAKGKQIRDWHLNRRSGTDLSGLASTFLRLGSRVRIQSSAPECCDVARHRRPVCRDLASDMSCLR